MAFAGEGNRLEAIPRMRTFRSFGGRTHAFNFHRSDGLFLFSCFLFVVVVLFFQWLQLITSNEEKIMFSGFFSKMLFENRLIDH